MLQKQTKYTNEKHNRKEKTRCNFTYFVYLIKKFNYKFLITKISIRFAL